MPTPAWEASQQRLKREEKATTGSYAGSIWRQDGLVDAYMAHLVGKEMAPDSAFDPFTSPLTKELEATVWDEFKPQLLRAHSPAHQRYIHELLLQKQEDLTRLSDMGVAGNIGRFAMNAAMPDQLLLSMAGGWVARIPRAVEVANAARKASGLARLEAVAGVTAEQAARRSGPWGVAAGVATGAVENSAYEKLRQSVNFEDDSSLVVEAALMGGAITAPFAIAGVRGASRAASVAAKEHQVIQVLRAVDEGRALTPEQGTLLKEVHATHKALTEFEAGRIDEHQLQTALDGLHGPQEPAAQWLERYHERLREDTRSIIEDLFPGHAGRATGMAAPSDGAQRRMDEKVALEDTNFAPKDKTSAVPDAPPKTALALAFDKAKTEASASRLKRAGDNAQLRKAFDLMDAGKQKEHEAAWKQAEKARETSRRADEERMVNARQLALAAAGEHPIEAAARQAPAEAPNGPQEHATAPVEATPQVSPLERWVGHSVSWASPEGETLYGTVHRISPTGKLVVDTHDGPSGFKAVAEHQLDQFDGEAPSGFLPGSVGSAQVQKVASIAAQRTHMAEVTIPGTDSKVPVRFDVYALLNGSPLEGVRKLAYKLVKDAIQNDKFEAQAMTASEWKKQLQRTVAGRFHIESREAFDAACKAAGVPFLKRASFAHEFYSLVSQVTRGDSLVLTEYPQLAPHLQAAAAAQSKVYKTLLAEAQRAGVKGAEGVDPNDFYVNRVWHHGQIREAIQLHGEDSVVRLMADSILDKAQVLERMRKSPGLQGLSDAELLARKAKGFLGAIRSLEFSPALHDMALAGRDMGTLRRELGFMGVSDSHIDDLVDLMFQIKEATGEPDAGRQANLKFRFGLDEGTRMATQAGELRMADLFENDARVLVDRYTNSLAGHIGLAKHGITSQAEWAQALKGVSDEALENPTVDGARVKRDLALLEDVHRNITGRPMSTQDFSYTNRAATALRGYTRGVMLPQLGIAAAFELGGAIARVGFTSMLKQMPSLQGFLHAMRQGFIPDKGLARDVMLISGFGQEKAAAYMRAQEIESGFMGQTLSRFEGGANAVSHTVDVLSGNASFTSLTKQWAGMGALQQMADFAHGKRRMTDKLRERWVGQGISADDIENVLGRLKEFSVEKDGVLQQVRYEDWQKASPGSYEQFQTFLSRQVRDAIQDHDLGESMPFMHTTLGKVFAELKTFFLVAHAKNFLKNLSYHDSTALQVWGIGFVGEALAYMMQTAVNYPDQLDEKLQPDLIARAAYFRMAALGTASMLTETGYQLVTGGDSLVQEGMTANTGNRSFLNTPSLTVLKRLANVPATAAGAVLGTDTVTRSEARDVLGAIPGTNLYGLKAVGQWWVNTLPASDPEKRR